MCVELIYEHYIKKTSYIKMIFKCINPGNKFVSNVGFSFKSHNLSVAKSWLYLPSIYLPLYLPMTENIFDCLMKNIFIAMVNMNLREDTCVVSEKQCGLLKENWFSGQNTKSVWFCEYQNILFNLNQQNICYNQIEFL